jgi:nitrite reductase (NADH) large subunit
VKKKILDDAEGRKALWERLKFALDGEPDPWFEFDKAKVDARQFDALSV